MRYFTTRGIRFQLTCHGSYDGTIPDSSFSLTLQGNTYHLREVIGSGKSELDNYANLASKISNRIHGGIITATIDLKCSVTGSMLNGGVIVTLAGERFLVQLIDSEIMPYDHNITSHKISKDKFDAFVDIVNGIVEIIVGFVTRSQETIDYLNEATFQGYPDWLSTVRLDSYINFSGNYTPNLTLGEVMFVTNGFDYFRGYYGADDNINILASVFDLMVGKLKQGLDAKILQVTGTTGFPPLFIILTKEGDREEIERRMHEVQQHHMVKKLTV